MCWLRKPRKASYGSPSVPGFAWSGDLEHNVVVRLELKAPVALFNGSLKDQPGRATAPCPKAS